MKTLKIKWQQLVSEGQTCQRCRSTEGELEKALSLLRQALTPFGVEIILKKKELSQLAARRDPSRSNRIWINDRPLEEWVQGTVGQSPCCDVCGDLECRTLVVGEEIYETIPASLIVQAGFLAASQLLLLRKQLHQAARSHSNPRLTTGYSVVDIAENAEDSRQDP